MPPASRVGDQQQCPLPGHVSGFVVVGSTSVIIGGQPAARLGDMCQCLIGTPPQIASGSATVRINGLPAARIGDLTNHGGVLISGEPRVIIGG